MNKITSILKKAGNLLKKRYYPGTGFTEKEKYHLLSETDKELHNFLKNHLQKHYPDHTLVSEEEQSNHAEDSVNYPRHNVLYPGRRIIIDPIDGTTNFITGKPYFTLSIAIEEGNKIIESHVYNPISDEYYYADKKTGKSYYNREVIEIPPPKSLEESIVVLGLSYHPQKMELYKNEWGTLLDKCLKCLFWVTPAQTICNIARGRIDIFIDMGSSMYGQAAASLVLQNAGGKMFNYDISPYDHRVTGGIFISGGINSHKVIKTRTL